MQRTMYVDTMTHKKEDPIGIFLVAIDPLVVFFRCNLGVYRKERPGTIQEVGFSRWQMVAGMICHTRW
jgi:hypothetical protein